MENITNTKKVTMTALLAALALIFSYTASADPFQSGHPRHKAGNRPNLVVIVALYHMGLRYAIVINVVRIFIAGLLFSGVFGIIYSLAGAILSMAVMVLLKKTGLFSVAGARLEEWPTIWARYWLQLFSSPTSASSYTFLSSSSPASSAAPSSVS